MSRANEPDKPSSTPSISSSTPTWPSTTSSSSSTNLSSSSSLSTPITGFAPSSSMLNPSSYMTAAPIYPSSNSLPSSASSSSFSSSSSSVSSGIRLNGMSPGHIIVVAVKNPLGIGSPPPSPSLPGDDQIIIKRKYADSLISMGYYQKAIGLFMSLAQSATDALSCASIYYHLGGLHQDIAGKLSDSQQSAHALNLATTYYVESFNILKTQPDQTTSTMKVCDTIIPIMKSAGADFVNIMPYYLKLYELSHGRVDSSNPALRVEQHEYGISNSARMGTDNIQQCMVVVLRDPTTKITALAHFDWGTDVKASFATILTQFPPSSNLDVTLIGSFVKDVTKFEDILRQSPGVNEAVSALQKELSSQFNSDYASARNIISISGELNAISNRLTLKGGAIAHQRDKTHTGIVVDPNTGVITHERPTINIGDNWIRDGIINFSGGSTALRPAFFIQETGKQAILMNRTQVDGTCKYDSLTDSRLIKDALASLNSSSLPNYRAKFTHGAYELIQDFRKCRAEAINYAMTSLGVSNLVNPTIANIYVGKDAQNMNRELMIEGKLFQDPGLSLGLQSTLRPLNSVITAASGSTPPTSASVTTPYSSSSSSPFVPTLTNHNTPSMPHGTFASSASSSSINASTPATTSNTFSSSSSNDEMNLQTQLDDMNLQTQFNVHNTSSSKINSSLNKNLKRAEKEHLSQLVNTEYYLDAALYQANPVNTHSQLSDFIQQASIESCAGITKISSGLDAKAKPSTVTLIIEQNHTVNHPSNVRMLIKDIKAKRITNSDIICLERKAEGQNLGIRDVILLSKLLEHNQNTQIPITIPDEICESPIYQDARLYNVAKKRGIQVIGVEGKSLGNENREEYMAKMLTNLAFSGKNIIFPVGEAHIDPLNERLTQNGVIVDIKTPAQIHSQDIQSSFAERENKTANLQKTSGLKHLTFEGRVSKNRIERPLNHNSRTNNNNNGISI